MGRPLSYDRGDVLDRALAAFGATGYEATSLQDLVDATGLSRSSLYAAFQSKHGLYLAALDRYRERGHAELARRLDAAPRALDGLRAYLAEVAADADDGAPPSPGCLLTNAAVEVASRDADTARRARTALDALLDIFQRQVERAQREGDVPAEAEASRLARSLVATVYGLRALAKAGVGREGAEDIARLELERLTR